MSLLEKSRLSNKGDQASVPDSFIHLNISGERLISWLRRQRFSGSQDQRAGRILSGRPKSGAQNEIQRMKG